MAGNYRSGGHNKTRAGVTEDAIYLNVRSLNRDGYLTDGKVGTRGWDHIGQKWIVHIYGGNTELTITYRPGTLSSALQHVQEDIAIERVPKHYGGSEPYFICPGCNTRAVHLYYACSKFRCRRCCKLVHSSTSENAELRALRRARKIRASLGASPSMMSTTVARPPRMHRTTYENSTRKLRLSEHCYWRSLATWLERRY